MASEGQEVSNRPDRPPHVSGVKDIESAIDGFDDVEDREGLRSLVDAARAFLGDQPWVISVSDLWWGIGVPPKVGVFLARMEADEDADEYLWTVVGDLPSAYLVVDDLSNPLEALDAYCGYMEEWVTAVRAGDSLDDVMPTGSEPTKEDAVLLEVRVRLIRRWLSEGVVS